MRIAKKVSAYNRNRKWNIFLKEISPKPAMSVLDVGFADNEWSPTDNYIEKHYAFPEMITALGIVAPKVFNKRYPRIRIVQYDGNVFPFKSKEFDVCWSNAVIEHVGTMDKKLMFLNEIKRVSKKAFITTPNKYFPIETHTMTPFLHYLPKNIFDSYLGLIGKRRAFSQNIILLGMGDIERLLVQADINQYRIIKNKLFGMTLDFIIIF